MGLFEEFLKKNSVKYGIAQKQTRGILSAASRDYIRERFGNNAAVDPYRQELVRLLAPRGVDENKVLGNIDRRDLLEDAEKVVQKAIADLEPKATAAAKVLTGLVHPDALDEVNTGDANMAQALRMIFGKTATGRTAPGIGGVNHVHVGGNAQENIIFDITGADYVVLGVVDGHMDGTMSPSVKITATKVAGRKSSKNTAERYKLDGNSLKEA